MIELNLYSEKGLAVVGATPEQAEAIRAELGANVAATHNAKLGGWAFSRKREDRIRDIVAVLNDDLPGKWGPLAT